MDQDRASTARSSWSGLGSIPRLSPSASSTHQIDQDTVSATGSSRSSTGSRQILWPRRPLKRNSTSPTRMLTNLSSLDPPINVCTTSLLHTSTQSEEVVLVKRLLEHLLDGYDRKSIPQELEVYPPLPLGPFPRFYTDVWTLYRLEYATSPRMMLLA